MDNLREKTSENIRGKYFIKEIRKSYQQLINYSNNYPENTFFSQKIKINLNLTNLISDLSQYADTPECLKKYLKLKSENN